MITEPNVSGDDRRGAGSTTRLVFITPNFENNSLGRTFSLWLLARELGMPTRIVGVKGDSLWAPLAGTDFAADCVLPTTVGRAEREGAVREHVRWADLVVAIKPLPTSFGVALTVCSLERKPLALDVDDPDIEVRTRWLPWYEQVARWTLTSRYRDLVRLGRLARTVPTMVSNPTLAQRYPGVVIPHVRPQTLALAQAREGKPTVRFIGSPRGHKGLEVLRTAVASLSSRGYRLEITAPRPDDAQSWETWLGETSLCDGAALVASADIIAIPSLAHSWARAQLPAKLMDAMIAGRAVVASDTPPIRWAVGNAGILVPPGDARALASALLELEPTKSRAEFGRLAAARANEMFSVASNAAPFQAFVTQALVTPAPAAGADNRFGAGGTDHHPVTEPIERRSAAVIVAVLTYRRPQTLSALLSVLLEQRHPSSAQVSVLVVDNDPDASAEAPVSGFNTDRVRYVHEPRPGIAAARNRALAESGESDLLIFIDDDERPVDGWLDSMLSTHAHYKGTGVVGPVVSEFELQMDAWVEAGDFFRRRRLATGVAVEVAATNNLLLDLHTVRAWGLAFNERFGLAGGSDTLFTRQLTARGGKLVWCNEAVVFDIVPAERLTRRWVLQRALRSGNSWSRVSLFLGDTCVARSWTRIVLGGEGAIRLAGGAVRYIGGLVARSLKLQAGGARTAARGVGMLMGAIGLVYSEYTRGFEGRRVRRIHRDPAKRIVRAAHPKATGG